MRSCYCFTLLVCLLLAGCKEQSLPTYSGGRYVHLEAQRDQTPQEVTFNFATEAPLLLESKARLRMILWGDLFERDAVCLFTSDGVPLSSKGLFPAGAPAATYEVPVYRSEELLRTDYTITIELRDVQGATIAPNIYRKAKIHVIDRVEKPVWWDESKAHALGEYSDIKFRLLGIYMRGDVPERLDAYTVIAFDQMVRDFKKWWMKEWQEGRYHYYATDRITPLYETLL